MKVFGLWFFVLLIKFSIIYASDVENLNDSELTTTTTTIPPTIPPINPEPIVPVDQITRHVLQESKDFSWEPYVDTLPKNAWPAGNTTHNELTYIGYRNHDINSTVPGYFVPSNKMLFYVLNRQTFKNKEGIKILCSPHPEKFEWIPASAKSVRFMTQKILVQGGYVNHYPVLVGRRLMNGFMRIGHVSFDDSRYEGLNFAVGYEPYHIKTDFQVLTFNPNIKKIDKPEDKPLDEVNKISHNSTSNGECKTYNFHFD